MPRSLARLLASFLFAGAAAAQDQATPPSTERLVEAIRHVDTLRGIQRVFLSDFAVGYRVSAFRQQGGGQRGLFGGTSEVELGVQMKLGGVSDADLQALTDRLHALTVDRLRSSGLEVVMPDELKDDPAWRKLVSKGKPSGHDFEHYRVFTPTGMTAHGQTIGGSGAIAAALDWADGPPVHVATLIRARDMAAIEFVLFVDFARLTGRGRESATTVGAEVAAEFAAFVPEDKNLALRVLAPAITRETPTPSGGRVAIVEFPSGAQFVVPRLAIQPGRFVVSVRDASTAGVQGAALAANLIGGLLGGRRGGAVAIEEREAIADPVAYADTVLLLGRRYADSLAAGIRAAR